MNNSTSKLRTRSILLFIGFLYIQVLQAQIFTEQTGIILTGVSGHSEAWGDYDNDGDLDLLVAGNDGSNSIVNLYKNDGGVFTWQSAVTFSINTVYDVAWGDYDNDGDLDILIASTFNSKLYENKGYGTFALKANLPEVFGGKCIWADLDNDGYRDIILTGSGGTKLLKNNQDGTFTEQTNTMPAVSNYSAVACGDYDNDGDLDILLAGLNSTTEITKVFRNDGNFTFTEQTGIVLPGIANCAVAWADLDNDGDLDIILSGSAVTFTNKIYENKGSNTFAELTGTTFQDLYRSSMDIADYDNDGYKDIIIAGSYNGSDYYTNIYHNNGNKTFTKLTTETIPGVQFGTIKFGDYDNDGKLDLFVCGNASTGKIAKIYKNGIATVNTAPLAPSNLSASVSGNNVTFTWNKTTDTQTSQNGLSYNLYIYKVGATDFKCSPLAFKQTDAKNGQRLVAQMGNIQYSATGFILKGIQEGSYKWSLQAIDAGFKGGNFTTEGSFNIVNPIDLTKVGLNMLIKQITHTTANMQYNFMFTDGSSSLWNNCSDSVTNFNYYPKGFDLWIRQKDLTTNQLKVVTIANPAAAPTFTIDYNGETTQEAIPENVDYSNYSSMSYPQTGTNTKISITPGNTLYFRIKATENTWPSQIQTLTIKNRPATPAYSVDLLNRITNEPIAMTDEYSMNADMSQSIDGNGSKLNVKLGTVIYLCVKNTTTSFRSAVQKLIVPLFSEQVIIKDVINSNFNAAWGDYNNDGSLDILLTSWDETNRKNIVSIYKNNGDYSFTEQTDIGLTNFPQGFMIWGDYNNDGFMDIMTSGFNSDFSFASKIYKNNGNNTFSEDPNFILPAVHSGACAWGDYNNDNKLDILITGHTGSNWITKIFRNDGNKLTEQTNPQLLDAYFSDVAWGDYNNDGNQDILISGWYSYPFSKIYKNTGNNSFSDTNLSFTGTTDSNVAWGDYDNDGYQDIFVAGSISGFNPISKIYRNTGDNSFMEQTNISLTGVMQGKSAWGDYDNDGYLDLLVSGNGTGAVNVLKLYHNNGDNTFTEQAEVLPPSFGGNAIFGDYDNDGDLDVLMCSNDAIKLYRNNTIVASPKLSNTVPQSPTNLIASIHGNEVNLKWGKATDVETPQNGLSYNIYVYKEGESNFIKTPQAFTQGDSKNGQRLIPQIGSIQYSTNGYTLKNIPTGNYKWSVQAIDAGFQGGSFAPESSFKIVLGNEIGVNVMNNQITNTRIDIEYSIDSKDGIDGTWQTCSAPNTTANFGLGGFDVWIREKGTSENRKIATIDYPAAAPTNPLENDTTNTFNWTFNPLFTSLSDYEFSKDNGISWSVCTTKPISVGNKNIPLGYFQVRVKASSSRVMGEVLKSDTAFTIPSGVGISSITDAGISIYPNPVRDLLYLENVTHNSELTIFTIQGKSVKKIVLTGNKNEIPVSEMPSGIYLLILKTGDSEVQTKFIKQ